jgi:hypothetical protein
MSGDTGDGRRKCWGQGTQGGKERRKRSYEEGEKKMSKRKRKKAEAIL